MFKFEFQSVFLFCATFSGGFIGFSYITIEIFDLRKPEI